MEYNLRPATPDDYDFLYQLHETTIRDAVAATWGWDDAFQQQRFHERFAPEERQIIVVGAQDVGVLVVEERESETFLGLIEIAVQYQNQGLGTVIIRDLAATAHARGCPLALQVLKTNPRAKRLYQRLGFRIVEEMEERYRMLLVPPA